MLWYGRNEFPQDSDLSFKMYREDLSELSLLPGQFDAVTFWHVLEHLENPGEALVAAGRLLKFKAWIVVAVPDYSSLQAKLFGKYWFHLDWPRHLHHFKSDWLCGKLA
jgi:2-polyprenyl-3-methyl-5-hydroxy-6-metoxy-1,4-benzoquinol methylase